MRADSGEVGRYQLVERLAVGGMAEIFLACERGAHGFERLVVIKRMLPNLAEDDAFVEMFLQEARLAAQITHPNVVQIHELGEAGGFPYMAMEYVPGSTLRQLLQATLAADVEIPVEVAVDMAMQACAGAHAVHELRDAQGRSYGLVHRDLTPHNMMITDEGFLKILDFGIAKATTDDDLRTRTGVLKGKIAYMSPEQCMQEPLDRRSDIFTLGNVAWELLAREKLFSAPNEVGVMQAIITGDVRDLRQVRPEAPDPVVNAIERALAPSRDSRYETADEMRRALSEAAAAADLDIDRDRTSAFVLEHLGHRHAQRRQSVEEAMDKTMVTLEPGAKPAEGGSLTQVTAVTRVGVAGVFGALVLGLAGGAFVLAGLALLVAGVLDIDWFAPGPAVYEPPPGEPVDMALAPILEAESLASQWEPLRRYLEQSIDQPIDLRVGDSYGDVAEGLVTGELHYAVLPPYLFLRTRQQAPDAVYPLATKVYDGSNGFEGLLLVHEDSTASRIEDLVGGTICYSDQNSTTGYVFPRLWIREAGLDPDQDFQAHFSGNHTQVLRDLLAGVCDVGGTYTGNYTSAAAHEVPVAQLRILAITGSSPHDTVTAGPAADPETSERLRQALLAFDPMKELGRERVGDLEQITGFVPVDQAAFSRLEKAVEFESQPKP